MIKPEIILLTSPDLDDMETGGPENFENFCVLVQALIGAEGEEGAEVFYFSVCTPNALESRIPEKGGLTGKSFIFVRKYDYSLILNTIQSLCDKGSVAKDWDEFAQIMTRYSDWEYEKSMS